jgi:hypothetical protein
MEDGRWEMEDGSKREWKIEYEFEHGLGVED